MYAAIYCWPLMALPKVVVLKPTAHKWLHSPFVISLADHSSAAQPPGCYKVELWLFSHTHLVLFWFSFFLLQFQLTGKAIQLQTSRLKCVQNHRSLILKLQTQVFLRLCPYPTIIFHCPPVDSQSWNFCIFSFFSVLSMSLLEAQLYSSCFPEMCGCIPEMWRLWLWEFVGHPGF